MQRKTLMRDARAAYLLRVENSARTVEDFEELTDMYDQLDANRERKERYHEIKRSEYNLQYTGSKRNGFKLTYIEHKKKNAEDEQEDKPDNTDQKDKPIKNKKKESSKNYIYSDGAIIPPPLCHPYWRELMRGDFISYIFDDAREVWQIVGDWQVGRLLKNELTYKQKETLFLSAVRLSTTEQIGCYTDKTDRAVRRLLAAAFENIRKPLAKMTRTRLDAGLPVTIEKRRFFEWYDKDPDGE